MAAADGNDLRPTPLQLVSYPSLTPPSATMGRHRHLSGQDNAQLEQPKIYSKSTDTIPPLWQCSILDPAFGWPHKK